MRASPPQPHSSPSLRCQRSLPHRRDLHCWSRSRLSIEADDRTRCAQAYLDRIEAYDKRGPLINFLITINPHALEEADRLDALLKTIGKLIGPLHGIPVIVKDNIDVAGLPMTSGFQGWKNYVPPSDATIVKKFGKLAVLFLRRHPFPNLHSVLPTTSIPWCHVSCAIRITRRSHLAGPRVAPARPLPRILAWWVLGRIRVAQCAFHLPSTLWLDFARPLASCHAQA